MSKQPSSHNTPRVIVEKILRLHIEEGYTYRQLAEKFRKPFKTIQNMIHNEYKKQRQLLECSKVLRSASTFLNPITEQYLALRRENCQLWMENEKDVDRAEMIRQCHEEYGKTYGYRRVKLLLEREKGFCFNGKTVLRIMQTYGRISEIRRRKGIPQGC